MSCEKEEMVTVLKKCGCNNFECNLNSSNSKAVYSDCDQKSTGKCAGFYVVPLEDEIFSNCAYKICGYCAGSKTLSENQKMYNQIFIIYETLCLYL